LGGQRVGVDYCLMGGLGFRREGGDTQKRWVEGRNGGQSGKTRFRDGDRHIKSIRKGFQISLQ
jgi:hypothetical protein